MEAINLFPQGSLICIGRFFRHFNSRAMTLY